MTQRRKITCARRAKFKLFYYVRGSAAISLLVLIIIIGSVFMVGGVFPKPPSESSPTHQAIPDTSAGPFDEKKSLQLETIPFKICTETAAVNFLIDNSGSMQFGNKMVELKKAMVIFGSNFPDSGILGIQVYSDPATYPSLGYKELIPISEYRNIKSQYVSLINTMRPKGATHSKDAMNFAKQKLAEAKAQYPDKKFNLVFISDGIPETQEERDTLCPGGIPDPNLCSVAPDPSTGRNNCRCFARSQDPTSIAAEIKNSGVRVFTISYVDPADSKFNNNLQTLMQNVASSPSDYFQAPVESQVTNILKQISEKLCN